jgi:hypothetical protein
MPAGSSILCDGCGQPASPEHLAQRLQRLEWCTRFRPIHLHTLLLGAFSPQNRTNFLYAPDEVHTGEAAQLFAAAGIDGTGKTAETLHSEFQRRSLYLTHVLECPLESTSSDLPALLASRLPSLVTRIRRSLKPRRLVLISGGLTPFVDRFASGKLDCELVLDNGTAFAIENPDAPEANPVAISGIATRLQEVLAAPATR